MTTIKHRIPNKNVRKRIYQIYIYIICFIQGKENFQSKRDYFAIISRCERKKYLLPCQNMLIKSNSTRAKRRGKKIYGKSPSMSTISDPKRIAHITLEPGVEDARVSWLWHTWPCIEYQGTLRSPALLLLLSKTMFECRSCVIHAARPVSPIPFPDICNPVHIYIYMCVPLTDVFETTSHDSPFAFSIRRNEHSCSLSCSWFTISLQPMLRKPFDRYLEPFVRSLVW